MMAKEFLNLNGRWRLGRVPQQELSFRGDDREQVEVWHPATVPGNIHADLMQAGLLPDLYWADGIEQAGWVDEWDWWLEYEVTLPRLLSHERLFLHFDAIDYLATIWLDDKCLTFHEGAFSRVTLEITSDVREHLGERACRLGVRLWGAKAWPEANWRWWERLLKPLTRTILPGHASLRPYHPRLRWLRAPMQAGWDFAPALAAIGLWEGVWLERTGAMRICHVSVGRWEWRQEEMACGLLTITLDARCREDVDLRVVWRPINFDGKAGQLLSVQSIRIGCHDLVFPLTIPSARRWYPWEQGTPHLYRLELSVEQIGEQIASYSLTFGIRDVEITQMRFSIHRQPFFVRGVNWVPADILLGTVPRARYEQLLRMARERGVNLVRVWGGGGRERREFYALCDELGLLVWQEFPFACAFLDHYPRDESFLEIVTQEVTAMVRELRHHPSLVLWCVGNEFSAWRNRSLIQKLAAIVLQEDERPFLPPSPNKQERHQWHVWHGYAPLSFLTQETAPFLSEFGLQALPKEQSLARFLPPDALWPPNQLWETHHASLDKLRAYLPAPRAETLAEMIMLSQSAQALAIQLGVERMRRQKAAGTGGVIIWQWNEPWTAISWALVDYSGQPKAAAERLADLYHPLLLSLAFEDLQWFHTPEDPLRATLWAINDLTDSFFHCEARLIQNNHLLWSQPLNLPSLCAHQIADICLKLPEPLLPFSLELWHAGKRLAHNRYQHHYLGILEPSPRAFFRLFYRGLVEWVMRW